MGSPKSHELLLFRVIEFFVSPEANESRCRPWVDQPLVPPTTRESGEFFFFFVRVAPEWTESVRPA